MLKFVVNKVLRGILLLFVVSVLAFSLLYMLPYDPVEYLVDDSVTAEERQAIREKYGLDRPLHEQYLSWLDNVLHGDLGMSFQSKQQVSDILRDRIWVTLSFTLWAFLLRLAISIPVGILCALKKDSWFDRMVMALSSVVQAIPNFWLALLLILLFSVKLGWLPLNGYGSFKYYILPVASLAIGDVASSIRMTRVEALEVYQERFVQAAYAKGLPRRTVIVKHVLRNSLILVAVMAFMSIPYLISGSIIIENIFAIPGMGTIITKSITYVDFQVVQASVLILAAMVVVCNTLCDIFTAILDPRVKAEMHGR